MASGINMATNSDTVDQELCVTIKWSGKEYPIDNLSPSDTVKSLKELIKDKTGVLPERQKLLGLKYKGTAWKNCNDHCGPDQ